ncbi:MAG: DUF6807 family protein [Rhodoglobus sp.]
MRISDHSDGLDVVADNATIAEYRLGASIDAVNTPKPHFHPLRTLSGAQITDFAPEDHPWHQGLQFAFPRVGDHNLWGGGTYFGPDEGYKIVADQGRIGHERWQHRDNDGDQVGWIEQLNWVGHEEQPLLSEQRTIGLSHTTDSAVGWMLDHNSWLSNVTDAELTLATPAQRGRPDGGYGGLFLRLAEGFTPSALWGDAGEISESGARSRTLVVSGTTGAGDAVTLGLAFTDTSPTGDQAWLYRFEDFPAIGWAGAYENAFTVPPGGSLELSHRLAIYDGTIDAAAVRHDLMK